MNRPVPKISCSLLAAVGTDTPMEVVVSSMDELGVDMIHYDVAEADKTLSLDDIPHLREHTNLPFDIHLTVSDPEPHITGLQLQEHDLFAFHVENQVPVDRAGEIKKQLGCRFGLAIRTETPIDALLPYAPVLDFVLFMAAAPGVSGGTFDFTILEKMEQFRKLFPDISIHVDGGVDRVTSAVLRDANVDAMISGSYILGAEESVSRVTKLLGRNVLQPVSAVMRSGRELPLVQPTASVSQVATTIDEKHIGCACVVDGDGILAGLITDGDLRRKLMVQTDLGGLTATDLMSHQPYTVSSGMRVLDVLRAIEQTGRAYAVVPVCEDSNRCVGVLTMQDVLRTE